MKSSSLTALIKNIRISPKKVAPVLDLVRGKELYNAKVMLALDKSKAAKLVLKAVQSAEANAEHNAGSDSNKLILKEIHVSGGSMLKSGNFVGRGRFNPILKRSSHLFVGLEEIAK